MLLNKGLPLVYLFILTLITGCFTSAQPIKTANEFKKLETLQQVKIQDTQLNFKVMSTGCTQPNDFIITSQIIDQQCQLSIFRIKADYCKRAAQLKEINISWDKKSHCGNSNIRVLNPIFTKSLDKF